MITKELQNKLVTRCQHPRTVVNKYTHEPVVVDDKAFALRLLPSGILFVDKTCNRKRRCC